MDNGSQHSLARTKKTRSVFLNASKCNYTTEHGATELTAVASNAQKVQSVDEQRANKIEKVTVNARQCRSRILTGDEGKVEIVDERCATKLKSLTMVRNQVENVGELRATKSRTLTSSAQRTAVYFCHCARFTRIYRSRKDLRMED